MLKFLFAMPYLFCTFANAEKLSYIEYESGSGLIEMDSNGSFAQRCKITGVQGTIDPFYNWDKSLIILDEVSFVSVQDVIECRRGRVQASHIPARAGFVVDVNLKKGIYLSYDLVGVSPPGYIARVAQLKGTRPLASFRGMYSGKKSMERMRREALRYDRDSLGRISPDGRYVSAGGDMRCGKFSYPGVWDLKTKKKLVKDRTDCAPLFGLPAR
ncbi:hypothetical protein [Robbsia andropogonis]|nr:hypothetical protein [Robbsia andropogonis]